MHPSLAASASPSCHRFCLVYCSPPGAFSSKCLERDNGSDHRSTPLLYLSKKCITPSFSTSKMPMEKRVSSLFLVSLLCGLSSYMLSISAKHFQWWHSAQILPLWPFTAYIQYIYVLNKRRHAVTSLRKNTARSSSGCGRRESHFTSLDQYQK